MSKVIKFCLYFSTLVDMYVNESLSEFLCKVLVCWIVSLFQFVFSFAF